MLQVESKGRDCGSQGACPTLLAGRVGQRDMVTAWSKSGRMSESQLTSKQVGN
jgi:hypothetical protein